MRSCQRVGVTQRLDIVIKKAVDAIRLLKSASMNMQFAAALRDPELHKRLDRDEFYDFNNFKHQPIIIIIFPLFRLGFR